MQPRSLWMLAAPRVSHGIPMVGIYGRPSGTTGRYRLSGPCIVRPSVLEELEWLPIYWQRRSNTIISRRHGLERLQGPFRGEDSQRRFNLEACTYHYNSILPGLNPTSSTKHSPNSLLHSPE